MKRLLALALLYFTLPAEAGITLKRGIALDIWETWPDEKAWSEPGFLDVFPEWRKTLGVERIAEIKRAGFDFVRLPIDPAPFLWRPDAKRTAHLIAQTMETVALFRAAGLNVVVDLHSIPDGGYRQIGTGQMLASPEVFAEHRKLVAAFAEALRGADGVALEPFNEPTNDCDDGAPPQWPAMLKSLHAAARASAPDLPLVVQGGCWGGASGLAELDPAAFKDANIIWSFHSYDPFYATHQGASWTDGAVAYVSGLRFPPELMTPKDRRKLRLEAAKRIQAAKVSKTRKRALLAELTAALDDDFTPGAARSALDAPFERVAAWAKEHDIPASQIFLGEFGAIRADLGAPLPVADRALIIKGIREAAETRGYWAVWAHMGSFDMTIEGDPRHFDPVLLGALGMPAK